MNKANYKVQNKPRTWVTSEATAVTPSKACTEVSLQDQISHSSIHVWTRLTKLSTMSFTFPQGFWFSSINLCHHTQPQSINAPSYSFPVECFWRKITKWGELESPCSPELILTVVHHAIAFLGYIPSLPLWQIFMFRPASSESSPLTFPFCCGLMTGSLISQRK